MFGGLHEKSSNSQCSEHFFHHNGSLDKKIKMLARHKDMRFAAFAFVTPTQKLTLKPKEGKELISSSGSCSSSISTVVEVE